METYTKKHGQTSSTHMVNHRRKTWPTIVNKYGQQSSKHMIKSWTHVRTNHGQQTSNKTWSTIVKQNMVNNRQTKHGQQSLTHGKQSKNTDSNIVKHMVNHRQKHGQQS
jgi:hypothetical protein